MKTFSDGSKVRKVVGREGFTLKYGEVDLNLVQPTRMNRERQPHGVSKLISETQRKGIRVMRAALVNYPEDAASRSVRLARHDLVDKPVEGPDAVGSLDAPEDSRAVNVQCCKVGPRSSSLVLMLDALPATVGDDLGFMKSDSCLDARLLVGRDHEFVLAQSSPLPFPLVKIEYRRAALEEQRVSGPDPRAVSPGLQSIGVEDTPDRRAADRFDVLFGNENPPDVRNEQTAERFLALGGNLTRDALDRRDDSWGGKTGEALCEACPGERILLRPSVYASSGQCSRGPRGCDQPPGWEAWGPPIEVSPSVRESPRRMATRVGEAPPALAQAPSGGTSVGKTDRDQAYGASLHFALTSEGKRFHIRYRHVHYRSLAIPTKISEIRH